VTAATATRTTVSIQSTGSRFAALKSRGYRIYLTGQSLANTGTWMQAIAQDWLVLHLTHSAFAVGLVMTLQFLPTLAFGVYGGQLADRYSRRRILLCTQTANAVLTGLLAALTAAGVVRPAHLYGFALLSGLILAVDAPTRQAFLTDVVPAGLLRGAVSLNAAVFQTTRLVGPRSTPCATPVRPSDCCAYARAISTRPGRRWPSQTRCGSRSGTSPHGRTSCGRLRWSASSARSA
jgi:MFS family permease